MTPRPNWTLLLVEDDDATAYLQQRYLERHGYLTRRAANTEAAWAAIRAERIDLIVLDFHLTGAVSGLEFHRALIADGMSIPVILVTGQTNADRIVEALRDGVRDYVTKTGDYLSYLVVAVDRVLKQIVNQRRLAMQYEITRLLSESRSLAHLVPDVLRLLTAELGWETGCVWKVDPVGKVLRCVEMWNADDADVARFALATRQLTFERGKPLPGHAWECKSPVLHQPPAESGHRSELIAAAGFRIGLSCPIVTGDEVRGVIEFFGRSAEPPDAEFMELLASLSLQISQLIERKQIEDQLLAAQNLEAVGRLAGGIAHDFNNLLTVVTGQVALLLAAELSPEESREALVDVQDAAVQAAVLTKQLLAFSRKQLLKLTSVDLALIAQQTAPSLKRLLGDRIELQMIAAPELGRIKGDAAQIEQILVNFAVNAVDAMPDGGRFTIELSNVFLDELHAREIVGAIPGAYVLLAVTDTGRGMDPATLNRIFDPYFSTKPRRRGTGLGLAMVYGVIKQTGGHIWVYSEPGQGTIFKTYFPRLTTQPQAGTIDHAARERRRGHETILLVEDEPRLRAMACKALRSFGYEVLEAADGAQALQIARERTGPLHLMVSDVVMPGISALDLRDELQAARPAMRTIWMSGYTADTILAQGVLDGTINFLSKPFSPELLGAKVREVLDEHA